LLANCALFFITSRFFETMRLTFQNLEKKERILSIMKI